VTVGEALAEARYRAGLTVDEVSERTRIREAVIRCIEQDDYDACGGDLYVHGYVRAIAGAIGIDAQPLIREYDLGRAEAPGSADAEADPAAAGTDLAAEPAKRPVKPPAHQGRRRWVVGIGVLAVLVVAGIVGGYLVAGNPLASHASAGQQVSSGAGSQLGSGNVGSTSSAAAAPTASAAPKAKKASRPATPAPIRPLPIARAEAFGPDGLADGDNPQSAAFAISRHSALPWRSQWYATADFGLLKHGTGLLLDMGRRVTISSVRIYLGPYGGANLQLRVGDTATVEGLKAVARASGAGGAVSLRLRVPARARYLLIWFTLLPPNGAGQFQASVYRVVVYGRP